MTSIDENMNDALQDCSVRYLLLPLPKGHGSPQTPEKRLRQPKEWEGDGKGKRAQGRGKGAKGAKGKKSEQRMPEALKGMHAKDKDGRLICFDFNLTKCTRKGCTMRHICAKCLGKHAFCDSECSADAE